ncbi:NRDE family protein [Thalassotalea sp. HSM 43]|uniref:NRDE family protein n=1 Tax=Thalassotalea sp. HSM 43 TaxID=2552945 RepID=UPI0010814857|nr:NRDE family protein [Thalassotalea sp. HSM 43]QBY03770.1 NRDE family protein [Thalassotalea sp. HSM 43]
MCILFIAIDQHPDYPLIIAANRDEFHARPTQAAHRWQQPDGIIAGKDLQQGGTWLGLNKQGQFAALTNIRAPKAHSDDALSRGHLVSQALAQQITPQWLAQNHQQYNPFNLIYSANNTLHCFNSMTARSSALNAGFHAVCNGKMDDVWPKMARGEQALEALVKQAKAKQQAPDCQQMLRLLQDTQQAPEHLLPDTGVGLDWERMLSSIFITSNDYGTRSSALVLKHTSGNIRFFEQTYDRQGNISDQQQFHVNGQAS